MKLVALKAKEYRFEVAVIYSDGTTAALYFNKLDFLDHLSMDGIKSIVITPQEVKRSV